MLNTSVKINSTYKCLDIRIRMAVINFSTSYLEKLGSISVDGNAVAGGREGSAEAL